MARGFLEPVLPPSHYYFWSGDGNGDEDVDLILVASGSRILKPERSGDEGGMGMANPPPPHCHAYLDQEYNNHGSRSRPLNCRSKTLKVSTTTKFRLKHVRDPNVVFMEYRWFSNQWNGTADFLAVAEWFYFIQVVIYF